MSGQHRGGTAQDTLNSPAEGMQVTARSDLRRTRKPEEVGQILGVGRNGVYELIRTGQLQSISVGRKILVPLEAIDEFLNCPER